MSEHTVLPLESRILAFIRGLASGGQSKRAIHEHAQRLVQEIDQAPDVEGRLLGFSRLALERVAMERLRQIEDEGYTVQHDRSHAVGEIAALAVSYIAPDIVRLADHIDAQLPEPRPGQERVIIAVETVARCHAAAERIHELAGGNHGRDDADPPNPWKHHPRRRMEIAGALVAAELARMMIDDATDTDRSTP